MFTEKDLVRKERRVTNTNTYWVGIYNCKECGKEISRQNTKLASVYCISCKNRIMLTKLIQKTGSKICTKCKQDLSIDRFTKLKSGRIQTECSRCRHLRKFDINSLEYDTLLNKQKGVCAICSKKESSKLKRRKYISLSVDHCHTTRKIRGLLCGKCNMSIGLLNDSPILLQKAIVYLTKNKICKKK